MMPWIQSDFQTANACTRGTPFILNSGYLTGLEFENHSKNFSSLLFCSILMRKEREQFSARGKY